MHDWHWIMREEAKGASHERCMHDLDVFGTWLWCFGPRAISLSMMGNQADAHLPRLDPTIKSVRAAEKTLKMLYQPSSIICCRNQGLARHDSLNPRPR